MFHLNFPLSHHRIKTKTIQAPKPSFILVQNVPIPLENLPAEPSTTRLVHCAIQAHEQQSTEFLKMYHSALEEEGLGEGYSTQLLKRTGGATTVQLLTIRCSV